MPPAIPASEEDQIKAVLYSEVKIDKKPDISEYTRACMKEYQDAEYSHREKILKKKRRKLALEEALFEFSLQYENLKSPEEKRKIDRKALGLIRRCCKGSLMFVRSYYGIYKEMKRGFFYIEEQEEEFE